MEHREQIPAIVENFTRVANDVAVAAVLCRQQVARPGIVTARSKGATDDTGKLAGKSVRILPYFFNRLNLWCTK